VPLVPSKWNPLSWVLVSDVVREAPAFDKHRAFPVVLFSHGAQNSPIEYVPIIEHMASHGYVVAAPWYNGDTQDDVRVQFINARNGSKVLDCLDSRPAPCVDPANKNVADRARDLTTVLDALPLAFGENLDMSQVFAMGHSRGTVTSLGAAGGSKPGAPFTVAIEPRVKAVLGLAAAMPALIFNIDLGEVTVPTVLIAGEKDANSPPDRSETVFGLLEKSQDKAFIIIKNAFHRHFAGGYCAEMQAAGSVVLPDLADPSQTRAILDLDTLTQILTAVPNGTAPQICGFDYFVNPVDIRPLVSKIIGFTVTPDSVPTAGIDTEEVGRLVGEIAVTFFDSVGKALRHEEQPCDGGVCSEVRFQRFLSDKFLLKTETNISTAVILTDEDMKQLDCREDCRD
jgi:predicted dienelactone hydrolase